MSSSNIRVFVEWKDSTVFAGEDIECTITFKNVALPRDRSPGPPKHNGFAPGVERQRKRPPVHSSTRPSISRNSSFGSQIPPPHLRGHRPALSLHTPSVAGERRSPIPPNGGFNNGTTASSHKHGRSLSIISMGTDATAEVRHSRAASPRRPTRGHGRSASLQVMPGRPNSFSGTMAGSLNGSTG